MRQEGHFIDVDTATAGVQTTFVVTNTADTGDGSLRRAIEDANANPGLDNITFNIASGVQTIKLQSALPYINSPVVIDATTQPGYTGSPLIELNGIQVSDNGLNIFAGNSIVRGLVINRFQGSAIKIQFFGGNVIEGNYIGHNVAGDSGGVGIDSIANRGNGVYIKNSPNNRIGGTILAARNVISANAFPDIAITDTGSTGNIVQGNYLGTDASGMYAIFYFDSSSNGVLIRRGASRTIVGGTDPGAGNVISGVYRAGIQLMDSLTSDNVIQGNIIGLDRYAFDRVPNQNGIRITNGASNNVIGGTTIAARNVISGNSLSGIIIDGADTKNNIVMGNIIGTRASGDASGRGNLKGIVIDNSPNNTIGGIVYGADNLIAANKEHGIEIRGSSATGNHIEGNYIGAPANLSVIGLGNFGSGVFIDNAPNNKVGGGDRLARNYIGENRSHGVVISGDTATGNIVQGNSIGTRVGGLAGGNNGHGVLLIASQDTIGGSDESLANTIAYNVGVGVYDSAGNNNTIRHNSIFSNGGVYPSPFLWNGGMGIDLAPRGITPNDSLDGDAGANNLQNFPILDSAVVGASSIRIRGKLSSQPNTLYAIDFYVNDARSPSHFGEGQTFIGTIFVPCDASGRGEITATFPVVVRTDQFITAVAFDPQGNTSEFSRALCLLDSDGDGIMDCWESEGDGIDVNADGKIDLDLYTRGARAYHKDLFVEVDYMFGFTPGDQVLPLVKSAFAKIKNKYVNNPDGNPGINLFAELSPDDLPIPDSTWTSTWWTKFFETKKQFFGTDRERSDSNSANILEAKRLVYRYCIFADRHDIGGSSGLAELNELTGGNDFMVTLGGWDINDSLNAGTFMHELGHTLGLRHGGGDDVNYKPNYYSVMNYAWQAPQFAAQYGGIGWTLNYSPVALFALDENNLNESLGLNPAPNDFPTVIVPFNTLGNLKSTGLLYPGTAIDWDGNGDSTGNAVVPVDINYINENPPNTPSPGDVLFSYADWPNLVYNFRGSSQFPDPPVAQYRTMAVYDTTDLEMTPQIYNYLKTLPPYGIVKPLTLWSTDPAENNPISTAPRSQNGPVIASDGAGGAIIAWVNVTGDGGNTPIVPRVFAQRIDTLGGVQWQNNGAPISSPLRLPRFCAITSDGGGGAIIVWEDYTYNIQLNQSGPHNLYAQRVNRFGQILWATDGVPVTALSNERQIMYPVVTSDGQGGAIIVWRDGHSGTNSLYAQRINASGVVQWSAGGVFVTSPLNGIAPGDTYRITGDDAAGVIIVWEDERNGVANHDIYTQRVDSAGVAQWTANGVPICTATAGQVYPVLVGDGAGGAVMSWQDHRAESASNHGDIYAQRISSAGIVQWAPNGVSIATASLGQYYPIITTDGSGGAIIVFADRRSGIDVEIYAQRINAAGITQWATDGIAIIDTSRRYINDYYKTIVNDDAGGAIVIFESLDNNNAYRGIWAQRVDSSGSIKWRRDGVPISTSAFSWDVSVTSNRAGGAIITWKDRRADPSHQDYHIYAQNVTKGGGLGSGIFTGVGENGHAGLPSAFALLQNYPNPFNPATMIRYELPGASYVTLKVYNVLGQVVTTLADDVEQAGYRSVEWNASGVASGVYFYRLEATSIADRTSSFTQVRKMLLIR